MSNRIILMQSDPAAAQLLAEFFTKRGDKVWQVANTAQAEEILKRASINLAVIDLHMPGNDWLELLGLLRQDSKHTKVIVTNKVPDVRREWMAKEQGVKVFLRAPFSPAWIDKALKRLEAEERGGEVIFDKHGVPKVKISVRTKITFPYALLALLFTLAGAYLVLRFVQDSDRERFANQLYDSARLSSDWMVQEENRLLESLRLVSHTDGVAAAIAAGDTNRLRELVLPIAANAKEEAVDILDQQGASLLSLRQRSSGLPGESGLPGDYNATQGDTSFAQLEFVQKVLKGQVDPVGDKYAGLVTQAENSYFYITGPVLDVNSQLVGVVLLGKSLKTLVAQDRENTLAQVTIYNHNGQQLASTLFLTSEIQPLPAQTVTDVLNWQDQRSFIRNLSLTQPTQKDQPQRQMEVSNLKFTELLGPWEARGGEDLGVIGVSLTDNFQMLSKPTTRWQALLLVATAFVCVIALGILLAGQVTRPLHRVVQAFTKVAHGNLEVKVPSSGNDEVAVVAHAFNYMVSGLQEGLIYRELLGRTASPAVRDAMRKSFATGDLRLEGQNTVATVLMSDIRGFTAISEKEEPTTILNWLNEYFGELAPIVESHGGVIDKFEGDAMLAFFGVLPTPLPPEDSAFLACEAIDEMLKTIERINNRRKERGEPPLITGISAHTGRLTVGGLGASDRLNYTIIGDTVNTTQRLQDLTRRFGSSGAVISENTLTALKGRRNGFHLEPLGEQAFPGKTELLWVYRLIPDDTRRSGNGSRKEVAHEAKPV